MLFNIPYILFSRDHNENKAFKALFCVIPAITSQLVFNFLTDLFLLDIVIICSTDSVTFYLWQNIPTYLPIRLTELTNDLYNKQKSHYSIHHDQIYNGIKDLEHLFNTIDPNNYYNPILVRSSFENNFKEHE